MLLVKKSGDAPKLKAEAMRFTCPSGADDPFLAQPSGQGNVNRVDVFGRQQCFVIVEGLGRLLERGLALAEADEVTTPLAIPAGHGPHDAVAAVENSFPVFSGNLRRAENAPAHFMIGHTRDFAGSSAEFKSKSKLRLG